MNANNKRYSAVIICNDPEEINNLNSLLKDESKIVVKDTFEYFTNGLEYLLRKPTDVVFVNFYPTPVCLSFLQFLNNIDEPGPLLVLILSPNNEFIDLTLSSGLDYLIKPIDKEQIETLIADIDYKVKVNSFKEKIDKICFNSAICDKASKFF